MKRAHLMPFGAVSSDGGRTRFRLWAPGARTVDLWLEDRARALPMARGADGCPLPGQARRNDDLHHAFHVLLALDRPAAVERAVWYLCDE